MTSTCLYDVAISFLAAEDEHLALRLADLLQDRFDVFVYSLKQRDLVGRDGFVEFSKVFAEQSRVVVVLHRAGWGDAGWTNVEQEAIQCRRFDTNWDFAVFVPVDGTPLPKWFPKARIWGGLQRLGPEGLAGVIEARISDAGGQPRATTLQASAGRKQREIEREAARDKFRREPAVRWAKGQFATTHEIAKRLASSTPVLGFR